MAKKALALPIGNIHMKATWMSLTPEQIGRVVREARKAMAVTQSDLALTSGTGLRFISDLENGKPTCQVAKVLTVLQTLGIEVELSLPPATQRE